MRRVIILICLILFFSSRIFSAENSSGAALKEKEKVAGKIFPTPDAQSQWEILDQPFWKNHVVFKLNKVSDYRWPHRPVVAVNDRNAGFILSHNVLKVSPQSILENFNNIAKAESLQITKENIEEYAAFFARVYGIPSWQTYDNLSLLEGRLDSGQFSDNAREIKESIDRIKRQQKQKWATDIVSKDKNYFVTFIYFFEEPKKTYEVRNEFSFHSNGTIEAMGQERWTPLSQVP